MGAGDFLNNAVGAAQKDAQDGLKNASNAIASGEKSAQQEAQKAEQAASAAEKKAQQEVAQAQQQLAQAEQKAKQEIQQAQQQVQQAEQKLAAAEKQAQQLEKSAENAAEQQAQKELQQAQQQVANAEKQAQQAVADAQKKLADEEAKAEQAAQLTQQLESKVQQTVQQVKNEDQALQQQAQAIQGTQPSTKSLMQQVSDTAKSGVPQAAATAGATFAKLQQTFPSPDPVDATEVPCKNKSVYSTPITGQQTQQGAPSTMQQINELKAQFPKEVDSKSTFTPNGVSEPDAMKFLVTPDGQNYLKQLKAASPRGANETPTDYVKKIIGRALQQVMSGSQLPKALPNIGQPLLKIVPKGQAVKSYTPYFVTAADLKNAFDSGQPLGDLLGLPLASQAEEYDIHQVNPKDPANPPTVYQSAVASTTELWGKFTTSGGATQTLVPNPGAWTEPKNVAAIPGVKPGKK
ncbi:hypothetical protein [Terracidiphilus gabretensis]|uniref:hypothetical protein n=1 Tax=Terracidiphilus gabretensis TaxID=1577687 RepID=UPI00071C09F0|nr:hypothetical protein [Terracidiphilus gabretensis]